MKSIKELRSSELCMIEREKDETIYVRGLVDHIIRIVPKEMLYLVTLQNNMMIGDFDISSIYRGYFNKIFNANYELMISDKRFKKIIESVIEHIRFIRPYYDSHIDALADSINSPIEFNPEYMISRDRKLEYLSVVWYGTVILKKQFNTLDSVIEFLKESLEYHKCIEKEIIGFNNKVI